MKDHYTYAPRAIFQGTLLLFAGGLAAQPYYTFSQASEPYQEILIGTTVSFSGGFGQITAVNGSTFPVTGAPFTFGGARQLWVLDGGALNIDHAPTSTVFISGLFDSFGGLVAVDASSSVMYELTGSAGDQHLTVQWKNMRRSDGSAGHFVNFQIVMHQASGVLEVHYGAHEDGNATYTPGNGPNAGFYFADYNATVIYDRIWLTGSPIAPTPNTALTPSFTGLNAIPADGTVYRFTPTWFTGLAEASMEQSDLFSAGLDPESGAFVVLFNGHDAGTLTLHDLQGRVIGSTARSADRMVLGTATLPAAVYLIEYRTVQGDRQVRRVVRP